MISCRALLARGWRPFGSLSRTLTRRCTQHLCSRVSGKTSRTAAQNPSAPSPIPTTGARIPRFFKSTKQGRPALGAFSIPILHLDHFLGPVRARPHQHQRAEPLFLKPDVEVNPVGPNVHVVTIRQISFPKILVLLLPLCGQPRDGRRRQARCVLPQENRQCLPEIPGGQPPEVEN